MIKRLSGQLPVMRGNGHAPLLLLSDELYIVGNYVKLYDQPTNNLLLTNLSHF